MNHRRIYITGLIIIVAVLLNLSGFGAKPVYATYTSFDITKKNANDGALLQGWTFTVYSSTTLNGTYTPYYINGNLVTGVTNANGKVIFSNIHWTNFYKICETVKPGWVPKAPTAANGCGAAFKPNQNSTPNYFTFENYPPASLGDYVWKDLDKDGIQESGEPPVSGVIVDLFGATCSGTVLATDTTDGNGLYLFNNLQPGTYRVRFTLPSGYFFTLKDTPSDDAKDSDANTSTGCTATTTLTAGENDLTWDAGIYPMVPGIEIKKYTNGFDADTANGADVPKIVPGAPVTWTYIITNTGNVPFAKEKVVVTDDRGVTPVYTGADTVLDPGESWLFQATGSLAQKLVQGQTFVVSGCAVNQTERATYNNTGTVTINYTTILTDSDPSHYCNPMVPGISIKKYTNGEDADSPTGPQIPLGGEVTWTYKVTNTGNVPLSNVVVTDNIPGVTPVYVSGDTNGNLKLDLTEEWLFSTKGVAVAGQYANTGTTKGTPPEGPDVTDNDPSHYYGDTTGLGDYVWEDVNGDGVQGDPAVEKPIAGVKVKLLDALCDAVMGETTTNGSGIYGFINLVPGTYCVQFELPAGYTFTVKDTPSDDAKDSDADPTTGKTTPVTLAANVPNLTLDAGLVTQKTLAIQATPLCIKDAPYIRYTVTPNFPVDANPVTIRFLDAKTNVLIENTVYTGQPLTQDFLWPGVAVDPVTKVGVQWPGWKLENGVWIQIPTQLRPTVKVEFAVNPTNIVTLEYPPSSPTCSTDPRAALGDTVWLDRNNNGLQDLNEAGVPNVEVRLFEAGGTAVATQFTNANGKYLFDNLMPGSYFVVFVGPAGYSFTRYDVNVNSQDASDSDGKAPNVDVSISTGGAEAKLGEPLTFTVFYTNTDPTLATTNLVITQTIPEGTTFVPGSSSSNWSCTGNNAGDVCTLTLGSLLPNASGSVTLTVLLSISAAEVPDVLELIANLSNIELARTANVDLSAGETDLTVDAGLVVLQAQLFMVTPTSPTNLPEDGQPDQADHIFLPTVGK